MAAGKPKTPWGRAYSAKFGQLKKLFDAGKLKVRGAVVKTWKQAFKAIGGIARSHADSVAKNPIASKRARKSKPKKASKAKPKSTRKPGRVFSALKRLAGRKSPRPPARRKSADVELVKVHFAGGGELVNKGGTARIHQDGSREFVSGGSWTPLHARIGRAREIREGLTNGGMRINGLTVLVDGRPQERSRSGKARFEGGKLFLERA